MLLVDLLLLGFTLLGHFAICVWLYNRMHARNLPRRVVYLFDRVLACVTLGILLLYAWRGAAHQAYIWNGSTVQGWQGLCLLHAAIGITACLVALPRWVWPKLTQRPPAALKSDVSRLVDIRKRLGFTPVQGFKSRLWTSLPGNQATQLSIHRKELVLERWPKELDGLTIAHLSDLHMIGKLTIEFYRELATEAQALRPDLFLISGDILEKPGCLPWVKETLAGLSAPLGKYFVFGNHELRLPAIQPLSEAMLAAGWTNLAGRSETFDYQGHSFQLVGNARPWFGDEPTFADRGSAANSLPRILLAHTPDLFPWAQAKKFDLMLAGHTHGGQIRLPIIGPLISPSAYGFRYASGVFAENGTVMHVSRGISGEHLLRWNCPPELTLLTLRAEQSSGVPC